MYTYAQVGTYHNIYKKDIIYFDTTGSIIKQIFLKNEKDFQIYNMLVRKFALSLPINNPKPTRCDRLLYDTV